MSVIKFPDTKTTITPLSEIDDQRFRKLIDALQSEEPIEIFGLIWKVAGLSYHVQDGKSTAEFDLDVVGSPWDGVSKNTIENGITGSMRLRIESVIPEKWSPI